MRIWPIPTKDHFNGTKKGPVKKEKTKTKILANSRFRSLWDSANKSPHIFINLWFYCLQFNVIILKNPRESGKGDAGKMFYEIDNIGTNIRYHAVFFFLNLELETTRLKWIMILVRFRDWPIISNMISSMILFGILIGFHRLWLRNWILTHFFYCVFILIMWQKVDHMLDHASLVGWSSGPSTQMPKHFVSPKSMVQIFSILVHLLPEA